MRRRIMASLGKHLPYDAEVEWVMKSVSDPAYINFRPDDNDVITWSSICNNSGPYAAVGLNSYIDEQTESTRIIKDNKSYTAIRAYFRNMAGDGGLLIRNVDVRQKHQYKLEKGNVTIDGTSYALGEMSAKVEVPERYIVMQADLKVFAHRIDRGGVTIINLKPVRVGNKGYYYDEVSGDLLFGDLIDSFGPDKTT